MAREASFGSVKETVNFLLCLKVEEQTMKVLLISSPRPSPRHLWGRLQPRRQLV